MLRAAVIALTLAGCYSPSVIAGVACVNACPGDQLCINNVCRDPDELGDASIDGPDPDAPIDGAPDVDTDGDGLFDNVDNCFKVANIDQHDEDHDALGDPCDPCPHIAIGAAADADSDGVGDACDPEPATPRQSWAYFDPFTSRRTGWSATPDATFANDQMRLTGYIELDLQVPNARVQAGGSLTVGANTPHQAVMEFGQLDDDHDYYVEFYDEGDGGGVKISKYVAGSFIGVANTGYSGVIPSGPFMWTTDYSVAAQSVTFNAKHGATTFPSITGATTSPALGSTMYLFFGAVHVTMTYDYLAVIATN